MAILHKNISAEGDIHNPKWFSGANNGDVAWRNELGVLESTDELVLPAALDFVDGSAAPPTSNSGDIYVLSSGASVNAGWGTVALGDWVRYDGTTWNDITPQKSTLCYNETLDSLISYTGSAWVAIGGDSIYTADGTLTGNRTVDLGDNKLIVNFDVDAATEVAPVNFEFGGYWQGYTRWADSGAVAINVNNNDDALTIFNKVNSTNFKSKAGGGGYLGLEASSNNVWRINDGDTQGGIELGRNAVKFYFGTGLMHRIQQGGADGGVHFYESGIAGSLGYFIVGGNARVGTEKICLKEPVAIKGAGTSTGSALAIYDNDTTPVKVFEVLDNSTIKTNGNTGFTGTGAYTNFTIENGIITNAT